MRYDRDRRPPGACGRSEHERHAQADAGGLEVRLLRRLPACRCSIARTSCWRSPARSRSPTSPRRPARCAPGPYDLSLVEGSITTPHDAERIHKVRRQSKFLVTIGACATAGGIQALRNFADVNEFIAAVYAPPQYISTLATSTPISAHVKVDFELHGCPINKHAAAGGDLRLPGRPQAGDRRAQRLHRMQAARQRLRDGAQGTPCLGPVTHAGCGAICPSFNRGCYGCFGPMETPNTAALAREWQALGATTARHPARLPHLQRAPPNRSARRATAHGD